MKIKPLTAMLAALTVTACGGGAENNVADIAAIQSSGTNNTTVSPPQPQLEELIKLASPDGTLSAFIIPDSDQYDKIPQDPLNPINASKVELGKMLYHDTGLTMPGLTGRPGTWSCASCHQAGAGFKSGNAQGIGDGGEGYGWRGEMRMPAFNLADQTLVDHQPNSSPTILNVAFQDVMLWNGQFGNSQGSVNATVDPEKLLTAGTPKTVNERGFSGIESQAIAGTIVHRMWMGESSLLTTNDQYKQLVSKAVEDSPDFEERTLHDIAALSVAAFERTILSNQAPFQRWLKGDKEAMSEEEIAGAKVFFGKGKCAGCHSGPALSSPVNATADQMFMAIGFSDLDAYNVIVGEVKDADRLGRGGFTGDEQDNYKFKIPPLYNIVQSDFLGHGNSFNNVREVVSYKNYAVTQKHIDNLDPRFVPLNLTEDEINWLTSFLEVSLTDPDLKRYEPATLPSGKCRINDDYSSRIDLGCE